MPPTAARPQVNTSATAPPRGAPRRSRKSTAGTSSAVNINASATGTITTPSLVSAFNSTQAAAAMTTSRHDQAAVLRTSGATATSSGDSETGMREGITQGQGAETAVADAPKRSRPRIDECRQVDQPQSSSQLRPRSSRRSAPVAADIATGAVDHAVGVMWGWMPKAASYRAHSVVEFIATDTGERWPVRSSKPAAPPTPTRSRRNARPAS